MQVESLFEVQTCVCDRSVEDQALFQSSPGTLDMSAKPVAFFLKAAAAVVGVNPSTVSLISLRKMVGTQVRDAYGELASKAALHHQAVETTYTHYLDK